MSMQNPARDVLNIVKEHLLYMQSHPALSLGKSGDRFTTMFGFITGFRAGKVDKRGLPSDTYDPAGFREFVMMRSRPDWLESGRGWWDAIRDVSQSDEQALARYFELRLAFLETQIANEKSP